MTLPSNPPDASYVSAPDLPPRRPSIANDLTIPTLTEQNRPAAQRHPAALADLYWSTDDYCHAVPLYVQALKGNYSKAEPLLKQALAIDEHAPSGTDDHGILTAADAAELDLQGTELVVLSACETGLGTVRTGEGVYGLRRAFVLADARALLATLWRVADATTRDVMSDYYKSLTQGASRAGALRSIQTAMIAAHRHPYY